MRRTLAIALGIFLTAAAPAASRAQDEPQQAAALKAQLAAIQQQLDNLARKEAADHKFTEIGSSTPRLRADGDVRRVVRIYDISDLYAIAPAYPAHEPSDLTESSRPIFPESQLSASASAGLGGGGFGGGVFAVPSTVGGKAAKSTLHQVTGGSGASPNETVRTSIDNLIHTITKTIEPDQWDDVGGPCTIITLGASLVVSATTDMHGQIAALLDLFRKRWGSLRTVSVQAHWLWLTEDQLADAVAEGMGLESPAPYGALSWPTWKKLLAQARAADQKRQNYHAVVTCYNGQTVSALAGSQRLIVSGLTPVVGSGEKESAAYNPETKALQEGAALQITPVVTRTAKYVVADVHSRVNLLGDAAVRAAADKEAPDVAQVVAALDRPVLASQRLATTLRIPVDMPTLVGGMTFAAPGDGDANLYLFLTATVRELRDDEGAEVKADEKPAE